MKTFLFMALFSQILSASFVVRLLNIDDFYNEIGVYEFNDFKQTHDFIKNKLPSHITADLIIVDESNFHISQKKMQILENLILKNKIFRIFANYHLDVFP